MNPTAGLDPRSSRSPADGEPFPETWREALTGLIFARTALIRAELGDALRLGSKRALYLGIATFALIFAWGLFLAGGIAAIASQVAWPWYWITLAAGACHVLAGLVFLKITLRPIPPVLPVTRSEFQKDREWIEKNHSSRRSNG